jgi:hypothetical protein
MSSRSHARADFPVPFGPIRLMCWSCSQPSGDANHSRHVYQSTRGAIAISRRRVPNGLGFGVVGDGVDEGGLELLRSGGIGGNLGRHCRHRHDGGLIH